MPGIARTDELVMELTTDQGRPIMSMVPGT